MMNRKKTIIIAALLLLAAACGALRLPAGGENGDEAGAESGPARVEAAKAEYGARIEEGFTTTSTLKALEEVEINAKVTARVKSIRVKRGDSVKAGQLLIELDSGEPAAEYDSQKAQLAVSKAEAEQSKAELEDANREYKRYGRLRKQGYATQQEYDSRATTLATAKADYERARASVSQARAQLAAKGVNLAEYRLCAPITGVVMEDYDLTPGTLVTSGTNAVRVARVDTLRAVVEIPEKDINGIGKGMTASVSCESAGGKSFTGRVSVINPYVDESTRTVTAEILVDNAAAGYILKPGMFANVRFVQKAEERPLLIPTEAIADDGTVMTVEDGKIKTVKIEKGASQNGKTSVKSGLAEGTLVVLSGGRNLKDSDPVETAN